MERKTLRYILFIFGLLIFSFGISFGNRSLLGGNPMAVFVVGLSKHLPLSVGTCNLIVAVVEVIIGFVLDRKNVTLATVFGMVFGSYMIDFANLFILETDSLIIRIIFMICGILCYCLGLSLQQYAHVGLGNLDCLNFGLMKAFNVEKYHTVKWITDAAFLIAGYLLGGVVNVGTVLLLLMAGVIIEQLRKVLKKIFG